MKIPFSLIFALLLAFNFCAAQNHQPRFSEINVRHYSFELHLNDTTNTIEATANISIEFIKPVNQFFLDFSEKNGNEKGMVVHSVSCNSEEQFFTHKNQKLTIKPIKKVSAGEIRTFQIRYSGVPADGLVISENSAGKRTFFGDNWPDRAKNWIPTVDHPSDKATLEFKVFAPKRYKVVSNGYLLEEKDTLKTQRFTHWKEDVPLSTKIMVIGVADFYVGNKTKFNSIPVSSWLFSDNKKQGLINYQYGTRALEYFSKLIGPYSYEKLAHVQSKTRYGGMENAGCIFYHENSGISPNSQERLFAHEVAHQWFGNSVTEENWHHVWLSEGFATYLTNVYLQHFFGEERFQSQLKKDRKRVIRFSKQKLVPVIDTTVTRYIELLNANSYQKASWFLHMLRNKIGDDAFFATLKKYYASYRNKTALTPQFRAIVEEISGEDQKAFFDQWLRKAGHPVLSLQMKQTENDAQIIISQHQKGDAFFFPLEIEFTTKSGKNHLKAFDVKEKNSTFILDIKDEILDFKIDPDVKLLFEEFKQ